MKNIIAICTLLLLAPSADAQKIRPIPYPVFPTAEFNMAVNAGTRTTDGNPGPEYWVNSADYKMDVTVTPSDQMLRGKSVAVYENNSPDTLAFVIVHLRQNLHKAGAVRNRPQKLTGGVRLQSVTFKGEALSAREGNQGVGYTEIGTILGIWLPESIAPNTSAEFEFEWAFKIPEAGAPRMGQDGEVFYLGYWYPQFAVFDDVNTWKADQYQGNGEFYMDHASYKVNITAPEGWIVAATGTLQNPADVLSDQSIDRLSKLAQDKITSVVTADERQPGASTATSASGTLTWKYEAKDVRDFAFALSDKYVWDATLASVGDRDEDGSEDFSQIHSLYRPEVEVWKNSAEYARFSIEHLSGMLFPYPYPQMTAVEGIIGGGMEYPMITLIGGSRNERSLFGVTYHEIAHMWFPMVVGHDEKSFTWMDEGLTSFNTNEGAGSFFGDDTWEPSRQSYYRIAGSSQERMVM